MIGVDSPAAVCVSTRVLSRDSDIKNASRREVIARKHRGSLPLRGPIRRRRKGARETSRSRPSRVRTRVATPVGPIDRNPPSANKYNCSTRSRARRTNEIPSSSGDRSRLRDSSRRLFRGRSRLEIVPVSSRGETRISDARPERGASAARACVGAASWPRTPSKCRRVCRSRAQSRGTLLTVPPHCQRWPIGWVVRGRDTRVVLSEGEG